MDILAITRLGQNETNKFDYNFSHSIQENVVNASIEPLELDTILSAVCNNYSFPTNLDRVQSVGGAAPESSLNLD